jgi:hypothetical protein
MNTEQTVSGLEFTIASADGTAGSSVVVDSEQVLVGSGPHCEIRLPNDQAAAEHVLITFLGGAIYAQARAFQPPPLLNGSPFTEAPLTPGSRIQIGQSEITVSLVEIADVASVVQEKKEERTNPLVLLLGALVVPAAIFILLDSPDQKEGAGRPAEVPALWAEAEVACSHTDPTQALAVARDKMVIALGRRERSPFDVRDGVLAVPLFDMAASCYGVADKNQRAKEMVSARERLKRQIDESYRAHQMRLEHSLDVQNLKVAQKETIFLLRLLEGQTGPYMVWLSNLDRRLKLKLGKATKRR